MPAEFAVPEPYGDRGWKLKMEGTERMSGIVLVEPGERLRRAFQKCGGATVVSCEDIGRVFRQAPRSSVWIATRPDWLGGLRDVRPGEGGSDQRVLLLHPATGPGRQVLACYFDRVAEPQAALCPEELAEVMSAPERERRDLLVGAVYDGRSDVVVAYRGTLDPLPVPTSWFRGGADGCAPDPARLAVIDHGQTLRLGTYEAATDALLYEFDAEYRRRARKRAIREDPSLGGSIRRLRLQRGLRQSDFRPITPREIGRIERGEVERPHRRTLEIVGERLGVGVEELGEW